MLKDIELRAMVSEFADPMTSENAIEILSKKFENLKSKKKIGSQVLTQIEVVSKKKSELKKPGYVSDVKIQIANLEIKRLIQLLEIVCVASLERNVVKLLFNAEIGLSNDGHSVLLFRIIQKVGTFYSLKQIHSYIKMLGHIPNKGHARYTSVAEAKKTAEIISKKLLENSGLEWQRKDVHEIMDKIHV